MAISEVGLILADLKASTGFTWQQISDALGASSGTYVRKVAAGHRPGENLKGNLAELLRRGQVSKAVPRRKAKSGHLARVRVKDARREALGQKAARPAENVLRAPEQGRRLFRGETGKLGWTVRTGNPDTEAGRKAFFAALTSAGRGRKRVKFRIELNMTYTIRSAASVIVEIGGNGGYKPAAVRAAIKASGGIVEWLLSQAPTGKLSSGSALETGDILDIEVVAF